MGHDHSRRRQSPPIVFIHAGYAVSQRIRKRIEEAFGWRVVRLSIADERLFVFCAMCGDAFIERSSLTKSSASQGRKRPSSGDVIASVEPSPLRLRLTTWRGCPNC
jgi:hypothetical protein